MVALTNMWKQKEDISPCLFISKQDSIITERRHNIVRGVEEFAMTESAYANDAAFLFPSREIAERNTPRIMKHCAIDGELYDDVMQGNDEPNEF